MQLRDYLYLDRDKLEDYLAGLDVGIIESLKETIKTEDSSNAITNPPRLGASPSAGTVAERTNERTLTISAKHSFSRLYDAIEGEIKRFDDGIAADADVRKGALIEVTTEFRPSPVNEVIGSIVNLMDTMQRMPFLNSMDGMDTPQAQQTQQLLSALFSGDTEADTLPMVSDPGAGPTVLFVAKNKYILREIEEFEGEMTLVGKVTKIVPESKSVDMLELLKVLPRSFRRGGMSASFRQVMMEAFTQLPEEMGGTNAADAMDLQGPAYIVSPLAAFT